MSAYIAQSATLPTIAWLLLSSAAAQTPAPQLPNNDSVTISVGNKFQEVVPANNTKIERRGVRISNNNSNGDDCWVYLGSDRASKEHSEVLSQGKSYVRYWPFVPSDTIQATCASSSDTLHVEYQ